MIEYAKGWLSRAIADNDRRRLSRAEEMSIVDAVKDANTINAIIRGAARGGHVFTISDAIEVLIALLDMTRTNRLRLSSADLSEAEIDAAAHSLAIFWPTRKPSMCIIGMSDDDMRQMRHVATNVLVAAARVRGDQE